jgi:hypothetical protein
MFLSNEADVLRGIADPNEETVAGLQQKLLFMVSLLQSADARPTAQGADAVKRLSTNGHGCADPCRTP